MNRFSQFLIHELDVLDNAINVCNCECDESAERRQLKAEIKLAKQLLFRPQQRVITAEDSEKFANILHVLDGDNQKLVVLDVDHVNRKVLVQIYEHDDISAIKSFEWQPGVKVKNIE